jgi:hypothetical protein
MWWPLIAFWLALIGWCAREGFIYMQRRRRAHEDLERRVAAQERAHQSHEDICSRRYAEIAVEFEQLRRVGDMRHAQLEKVGDERHKENLERFDTVMSGLDHVKEILMDHRRRA